MYSLLGRKFILIFFFTTIQICLNGEENYWEKVKVENQVSVYRAKIDGKIAFRGVREMWGNPESLVSIIEDRVDGRIGSKILNREN